MEINEIRLEAQDLNQQGVLLLKMGNIEPAREKFERAIEIDPMLMSCQPSVLPPFWGSTQPIIA